MTLPVEIKQSLNRHEQETARAAQLHSKAADLITKSGRIEHVNPDNDRSIEIFSVTKEVDEFRFRIWTDKKHYDSIPPTDDMDRINIDFIPVHTNSLSVNRFAELTRNGEGSRFGNMEIADSNLLSSASNGLELSEKILDEVFGI